GNPNDDALGTVQPGDIGWNAAAYNGNTGQTWNVLVGRGAYVDLGYGRYAAGLASASPVGGSRIPMFAGYDDLSSSFNYQPMHPRSQLTGDWNASGARYNPVRFVYYDTWALSYERDGINQDVLLEGNNPIVDQGTDGLDGEGNPTGASMVPFIFRSGADDGNERETMPPFDHPLRGIEVTVRLYEPGTRQVRQATVGADFIPE
ncbi:MAG: hypothetical protein N2439_07125, partial [Anaerolineae bacterium]|nr:hypothetical protein [Anaerolineae bacterium]